MMKVTNEEIAELIVNECDHVVGYYNHMSMTWDVELSRLFAVGGGYWYRQMKRKHNFCPKCGADLTRTWAKVKEECDDKTV